MALSKERSTHFFSHIRNTCEGSQVNGKNALRGQKKSGGGSSHQFPKRELFFPQVYSCTRASAESLGGKGQRDRKVAERFPILLFETRCGLFSPHNELEQPCVYLISSGGHQKHCWGAGH